MSKSEILVTTFIKVIKCSGKTSKKKSPLAVKLDHAQNKMDNKLKR